MLVLSRMPVHHNVPSGPIHAGNILMIEYIVPMSLPLPKQSNCQIFVAHIIFLALEFLCLVCHDLEPRCGRVPLAARFVAFVVPRFRNAAF